MSVTRRLEIACVSTRVFWQYCWRENKGLGKPGVISGLRVQLQVTPMSQQRLLDESLLKLISTHLEQMELSNLNGYVLLHQYESRTVLKEKTITELRSAIGWVCECCRFVGADSLIEFEEEWIKPWFRVYDYEYNLPEPTVAIQGMILSVWLFFFCLDR